MNETFFYLELAGVNGCIGFVHMVNEHINQRDIFDI